eukprot:Clim_evm8s226 gene=Clim_evmTU8s226
MPHPSTEVSETIYFATPLVREKPVGGTITIQNKESKDILFKVKTTQPKKYCVRPNQGMISAGETRDIDVILRPPEDDYDVRRDKFLVLTMFQENHDVGAPTDDEFVEKLTHTWRQNESNKDIVKHQKLRCDTKGGEENNDAMETSTETAATPVAASAARTAVPAQAAPAAAAAFEEKKTPAKSSPAPVSKSAASPAPQALKQINSSGGDMNMLFIILAFIIGIAMGRILLP